jgi:hypothetical protein
MPYIVGTRSTSQTLELTDGSVRSAITTTSSINQSVLVSLSTETFRSVNYQIQITEGSNFNMTSINVIHNGSNTYMTEFGSINEPVGIATFTTDIDSGNVRLLAYPSSSNLTTFKVIFTAIKS